MNSLISCRNIFEVDKTSFNSLVNKVILNINVLHINMKLRISKQLNCFLIVSLNNNRIHDTKTSFTEKTA